MKYNVLAVSLLLGTVGCDSNSTADDADNPQHSQIPSVEPAAQTTPTATDGANDPAIWIDGDDPQNSLILGAGLAGGLEVYDLEGTRIGSVGGAAITLVDVRSSFPLAGESVGLAIAYDIAESNILAYTIDPQERAVTQIEAASFATNAEIEGLCMYQSSLSGKSYVFAAGSGMIQQWELYDQGGELAARQVRSVPVGYGAGHCVGHDAGAAIYFSHETIGVFKMNAEPESEEAMQTVDVAEPFGESLRTIRKLIRLCSSPPEIE
jgi:3-phytase